jgi:hypothetical protein
MSSSPPDSSSAEPSDTSQSDGRSFIRRPTTLILASVALTAIVVAVLVIRGGSDARVDVTRAFWQAVADDDCGTLDDIVSDDGMLGERDAWIEEACHGVEEDHVPSDNITSVRVAEADDREAVVDVRFGAGGDERTAQTFLVKEGGEWKVAEWIPDEADLVIP